MKTKEELEKIIAEAQQELKKLENNRLWKPKDGENYYIILSHGFIDGQLFNNTKYDKDVISIGNYFKTEAEAKQHLENLKTKQQLKEIAFRLNDGMVIDWDNRINPKYFLFFDNNYKNIQQNYLVHNQSPRIYCLSDKFLKTALEEIGEERLINYLKGEA